MGEIPGSDMHGRPGQSQESWLEMINHKGNGCSAPTEDRFLTVCFHPLGKVKLTVWDGEGRRGLPVAKPGKASGACALGTTVQGVPKTYPSSHVLM